MSRPDNGPLFVILSFEGPDPYSRAGGLASRVEGLSTSLARMGFETHLFFVGDPEMPGVEQPDPAGPVLHRWCQWISRFHHSGVYDGEEEKLRDWAASLPDWVSNHLIADAVRARRQVFVLAEEWQTVPTVLSLDQELRLRGIRESVQLAWNANNVFGFNRIDWRSLKQACTVITISRFMKQVLARYGVDARVVPNGIPDHWFRVPSRPAVRTLKRGLAERFLITKIARWDPDKRWVATIESIARLKQLGMRPLLLARGGMEAHGAEVIRRARALDLNVQSVRLDGHEPLEMARRLVDSSNADLLLIDSYLAPEQSKVLYQASHAVLANSRMEPFGLVGLEAMASGGIAIVGSSGEDYVTPGYDAVSIQSAEAGELVTSLLRIYWNDESASRMRRAAKATAARYTWTAVINRVLLPYFGESSLLRSLEQERNNIGQPSGTVRRIAPPIFWIPEPVGMSFTVPPAGRKSTDSERLVHSE